MKLIALCLFGVVLLQLTSEGEGVCCHGKGALWKSKCADCSKGTPYCALGKGCNLFGCNCDGGCRTGPCHEHHYPAVVPEKQPHVDYPETVPEEDPYAVVSEEEPQGDYAKTMPEEDPYAVVPEDESQDDDAKAMPEEDPYYQPEVTTTDSLINEDTPKVTAEDIIQDADEDGDGYMNADEAADYLYKRGLTKSSYRIKRSLYELDVNNDNYITADELDPYQ